MIATVDPSLVVGIIILFVLLVFVALVIHQKIVDSSKVGRPLTLEAFSPNNSQEVYLRMICATSGYSGGYFDGTQVTTDGASTITVERRYVPTWAIVVAVIGFFFFFFGLFALLYRVREICQITLSDQQDGTLICVDGLLGNNQYNVVNATIASLLQRTD
jgi:nicotinamide riboside transporter PnuC